MGQSKSQPHTKPNDIRDILHAPPFERKICFRFRNLLFCCFVLVFIFCRHSRSARSSKAHKIRTINLRFNRCVVSLASWANIFLIIMIINFRWIPRLITRIARAFSRTHHQPGPRAETERNLLNGSSSSSQSSHTHSSRINLNYSIRVVFHSLE